MVNPVINVFFPFASLTYFVTFPWGSIKQLTPVLAERTTDLLFSTARNTEDCICMNGSLESWNQASLVILIKKSAPLELIFLEILSIASSKQIKTENLAGPEPDKAFFRENTVASFPAVKSSIGTISAK